MITNIIKAHLTLIQSLSEHPQFTSTLESLIQEMVKVISNGNKILICGNGGSAADAQHIATELSGRFYKDRDPINAEALHVNTSYLTAVANDIGFEYVFSRALQAKAKKGDLLLALSTSGHSPNVINAIKEAKKMGLLTMALTGAKGNDMAQMCDLAIMIPSTDTPRIQEAHMLIGHIFCQQVENRLFPDA